MLAAGERGLMPPERQKRKRVVASCTQCYSKKQKVKLYSRPSLTLSCLALHAINPSLLVIELADTTQCNHQYPCNHCTRRRRPELCVFASAEPSTEDEELQETINVSATRTIRPESSNLHKSKSLADTQNDTSHNEDHGKLATLSSLTQGSAPIFEASLPACFGYFEGSKSNLLGLMQGVNIFPLLRGPLY